MKAAGETKSTPTPTLLKQGTCSALLTITIMMKDSDYKPLGAIDMMDYKHHRSQCLVKDGFRMAQTICGSGDAEISIIPSRAGSGDAILIAV
jgi:hypothetical protein